jgi:putative Ca2+/H+ antiporter (TMEM165/GDT1 family)
VQRSDFRRLTKFLRSTVADLTEHLVDAVPGRHNIHAGIDREGDNPMVNWQTFLSVFATIFLAEIGDKTQLATMLFSSAADANKWLVWAAASAALVLAAGIGVLIGAQLERFVSPRVLKFVAGLGFIAVGVWTLLAR